MSRKGINADVFRWVNRVRNVVRFNVLSNGLSQTLDYHQGGLHLSHLRVEVAVQRSGECALVVGSFPGRVTLIIDEFRSVVETEVVV